MSVRNLEPYKRTVYIIKHQFMKMKKFIEFNLKVSYKEDFYIMQVIFFFNVMFYLFCNPYEMFITF